jgi:transcriptional regulator GlxA family with amidase domain
LAQTPALVDASAAELINSHVELTRIGRLHVDDVAERLFHERDPAARQRLLEDLVRPLPLMVRSARARRVASVMERGTDALRIDELAERFDFGVRSLERLCIAEFGISPKRLQRIVRLRRALRLLHSGQCGSLARLAQSCGYTDQSHLAKDFRAFTGRMPGEVRSFAPRPIEGIPRTDVVYRYRDRG